MVARLDTSVPLYINNVDTGKRVDVELYLEPYSLVRKSLVYLELEPEVINIIDVLEDDVQEVADVLGISIEELERIINDYEDVIYDERVQYEPSTVVVSDEYKFKPVKVDIDSKQKVQVVTIEVI